MALEEAAAGAVLGKFASDAVSWTAERIQEVAESFKHDRAILLVESAGVKAIDGHNDSFEYRLIKQYVREKAFRRAMLVGLYLRQLDHEQKRPELDEARSKIHRRGGAISLRLAEFVQCGLFAKSFSLIIGSETPDSDARLKLHDFLSNLSVYLRFIKSDDRPGPVSEEIKTILYSRKPAIYMMAAKGVSATRCADEARRTLSGSPPLNDYEELQMFAPEKSDFYLILRRKS